MVSKIFVKPIELEPLNVVDQLNPLPMPPPVLPQPNLAHIIVPYSESVSSSNCMIVVTPFEQTIAIEHFSHLIDGSEPGNPRLSFPSFSANGQFIYHLEVLPNGVDEERADFVSITLVRTPQVREENDIIFFIISILDARGCKRMSRGKRVIMDNIR